MMKIYWKWAIVAIVAINVIVQVVNYTIGTAAALVVGILGGLALGSLSQIVGKLRS